VKRIRQSHPFIGLGTLCSLFGVTRQAYYEAQTREIKTNISHSVVLRLVKDLREIMPMIGTRKLQHEIRDQLTEHGIKMGRDQLFDLLRFHGLLIRRRKRFVKTTDSCHWLKKYPNLITDIEVSEPDELWVSDITYVKTIEGYSYLSLITDAYSRKIVGFCLYPSLDSDGCIKALEMGLAERHNFIPTLIHHSDRGVQYCSYRYVEILQENKIKVSMTQSGNPYENALAERMNGIIKSEFFPRRIYQNHKEAKKAIERIIYTYNNRRPHSSLNYLTPSEVYQMSGPIPKKWKARKKEFLSIEFAK
jgi:transposase InsO family protein